MNKRIAVFLTLAIILAVLSGCAGTTVVVGNCTCPTENAPELPVAGNTVPDGTALKTGLAIVTSLSGSADAAESDGAAKYDVTIVAVTVDANGVIQDCLIDSLGTSVSFDASGIITSDVSAKLMTKGELGETYGMKASGSKYEWNEQVAALANYAIGKTADELKNGAVNESGYAADADLASSASIYIGGYVSAIEEAVNGAQYRGAKQGDELKLTSICSLSSSKSAEGENGGTAQLDCDVTVITMSEGTITSCAIDSVQAKVSFGADGKITTDTTAPVQTKNALGAAYGMKENGSAKYEWNEQAANFAAYITGMTPDQVAGIAVTETTAPAEADLSASVTISIGGFQALIAKAAAN